MLLVLAISIAASLALTPMIRVVAWKWGAVSWPDGQRRLHHQPTALWGGIAVCLALFLSIIVARWTGLSTGAGLLLPIGVGLPVVMLCLLGCCDDFFTLHARWKLLGQIVATVPVVLAGCCIERLGLFGYEFTLGWVGIPVTIGWLVLGINAMNLLDGMDGLASTVGIAVSLAIAAIAGTQGHAEIALLAIAMAGALAGFLAHNRPPARIYLGDCGSMVLGFIVSLLAMRVALADSTTATASVAIALLYLPLLDTGLAILRRALRGQSFMVADRGHIHHRLLDQGFNVWQVLGLVVAFSAVTGAIAWQVAVSGHELWAFAVLGAITLLAVNRRLVGHMEWESVKQLAGQAAGVAISRLSSARLATWLRAGGRAAATPPGDNLVGQITRPRLFSVVNSDLPFDAKPGLLDDGNNIQAEEIREAA